jgi:DMSO reductase family type II enzyme chaperone
MIAADRHRRAAPARSVLYSLLRDLLTFPTVSLKRAARSGQLDQQLSELERELPYELQLSADAFRIEGRADRIGSEYMRLFDLPLEGQPCPLYGGLLGRNRWQVMEELLRLYRHFGLSTYNSALRDLPDSIPTVLEFLHYLTYREGTATAAEALLFRTAQRDLLERHVAKWARTIGQRLADKRPIAFYGNTITLLHTVTSAELAAFQASAVSAA